MPLQSTPSKSGVYLIKVFTQDLYIESVPQGESTASTPWLRLASPTGHKKQQARALFWVLTQSSSNSDEWTIVSAVDSAGLVYKKTGQTYRGHGYPYPGGSSISWKIVNYGQFSKISAPSNGRDVFDSQYRSQKDDAIHFWQPLDQFDAPFQCFVFEFIPAAEDIKLDVVFLQDATGSQQPYINAARDQISQIIIKLKEASKFQNDSDFRFRLIAFRDHPPQERSFIVQENDFTSDISTLQGQLRSLFASGGGDGPEAQCDALNAALLSAWRQKAAKVVILITDSPPHGVEDDADGYPNGCPLQNDPVRIVGRFARTDITFNVIACEPTLSQYYQNALDFYKGLVAKTPGGKLIPMGNTDAQQLQAAIVGLVAQSLDNARLASQQTSKILSLAQAGRSVDAIVTDLYREFGTRGVQHYRVAPSDDVYLRNEEGEKNAKIWEEADNLRDAKSRIKKIAGHRIVEDFRAPVSFNVTYEQMAITSDDVNAIVLKVLKTAGIDLGVSGATMLLSWINTKVKSIVEALWYIGWCPPPATSQPTTPSQAIPPPGPAVNSPPMPETVKPNVEKAPPLWALVIGVDKYQRLNALSGCVADADDFADFLVSRLGVPKDHIKTLHNEEATRQEITSSIAALAKDNRIQNGDAIAIFYAGHGAEARPPAGWSAGELGPRARIQMLCAYDFVPATTDAENGQGIPDITLSVLLSQLAEAKGNNITVIFDSCFSGSGTRTDQYTPGLLVRGVKLPDDYKVLETIDQKILRNVPDLDKQRKVIISKDFEKTGAASHVLLAACSSKEEAKEDSGRGRFTSSFLSLLRSSSVDLTTLTYQDAISRMPDLIMQTPQCDGVYSSRSLFNGKIINGSRTLYRLISDNGVVTLEAGEAQGITKGATFDVFNTTNVNAPSLGSITADQPKACSTIMKAGTTRVPSPAWAVQTRVGEGMDVAIAIQVDDALLPVLVRAVNEMQTRRPTKRNLRFIDIKEPAEHEVALYSEGTNAVFELTDKEWVKEGLRRLPYKIALDQLDSLYKVFDCTADFFYHLRRSRTTDVSDNLLLAVYEVKKRALDEGDPNAYAGPVPLPKLVQGRPVDLNRGGVIHLEVEEGKKVEYGLKLSSTFDQPLYVWAFAFNMSDLSIVEIYKPAFAKRRETGNNNQQADPSIEKEGELTIGYGSGGARPLSVLMDDSDDVDVSYIKFFITTEYVDLSKIAQSTPFENTRKIVLESPTRKLFDTLLVTVVTKKVRL
ncbi:hypothetical protein GGX14DRAFT_456331 [Mycena pura]|uniref:VWFA domain-containing protein n=1 Tax=Mycena pura TaxID=153505 RepID=A0AAD6VE25_9AGAR|nr:hypothetical protein GGX14DRAFT_456331 [Mycena pura]